MIGAMKAIIINKLRYRMLGTSVSILIQGNGKTKTIKSKSSESEIKREGVKKVGEGRSVIHKIESIRESMAKLFATTISTNSFDETRPRGRRFHTVSCKK